MAQAPGGGSKRGGRRLGRGLGALLAAEPVKVAPTPTELPREEPAHAATEPAASQRVVDASETTTPATPPEASTAPQADPDGYRRVRIDRISPNPFQPRSRVGDTDLDALAASITRDGVLQPIVVRPLKEDGRFELVAGERRWRASQLAGLDTIPAIVRELTDGQSAELALIENLQREDLNVVDRARALAGLCSGFGLTQGEAADRVGLDRSSVSNLLRLLDLESSILDRLAAGTLSGGHGKALLSAPAGAEREALAETAEAEGWSVRETERRARALAAPDADPSAGETPDSDPSRSAPEERAPAVVDLERRLGEYLGTRVRLQTSSDGTRGRVVLEFFDLDQFDGLMSRIGFDRDSGG